MTKYDAKAVEALLAACDKAALSGLSGSLSNIKDITDAVNALRPPKKYLVMPTFEEAAKLAGAEIVTSNVGDRRFTYNDCFIWERCYNSMRELTATKHPPCNPFCKIPAGKDWSIEDLRELCFTYEAAEGSSYNDFRVMIDHIKKKYGV